MIELSPAGRGALRPSGVGAQSSDPNHPMNLSDIAAAVPGAVTRGSAGISDVAYDSRAVGPGALFFCVAGARADGHAYAPDAVSSGAVALVVERFLDLDIPQVRVVSVRDAMGPMAAVFFGRPSSSMELVGVTGTNGKTTTSFLLERCLEAAGVTAGLMGTVETHIAGAVSPVVRTTPEAIDLQRTLARMREAGVRGAAMEVSSHGIALGRVDATRFAAAVFTNLTQDHLDFHETMESYYEAKAALFAPERTAAAVVNLDDEHGLRLAASVKVPLVTFGVTSADAELRAHDVQMDASGSRFICEAGGTSLPVRVRLAGRFNVSNALAALAAMRALGRDLGAAAEGIASLSGVPGRFETIDAGQDFTVIVDYAHTPDSLARALSSAREICAGALWVVFGCGGDRDRGKRPLMGAAATALADRVIITSDNPRSEDPRAIIDEIASGATGSSEIESDRRAAIRFAVRNAAAGDVVLVAGKGHESGQEFAGGRTIPFDDRVVVREELSGS
jgi:UDP-N-acetylmuramoyl-L-alanyl-D-glutamate--2,6-diaminopimelate ligase